MANPILKNNFSNVNERVLEGATMTVGGTATKAIILLLTIVLSGSYSWGLYAKGFYDKAALITTVGFIVAIISSLIIIFARPKISNILAIAYSVGEGLVLGSISFAFESQYHGIVLNAVLCTFMAMAIMLLLYMAKIIRCTERFRSVIITATASVTVIYLIQIGASFFGRSIPQIFTASPIGIGFSALVCLIASLNFILDFDFIEKGANYMLPKIYEWIGAVGFMFSLVWLYLEMLRLLAKLNSRR